MNDDYQKRKKKLYFYKTGLFVLLGGVFLLALYLLVFILNPLIYRSFGPEGPEILKSIQIFLLFASIGVFGTGILFMIIGLLLAEDVKRSWLIVIFIAPTFFIMSVIVFIPLIQGISFSFTDASQSNMSKVKPVVVTEIIDGKPTRVRELEVIPPSFNYVYLENYIEIFTGKRKSVREEFKIKKEQVNTFINTLNPQKLDNGNILIVIESSKKMQFTLK